MKSVNPFSLRDAIQDLDGTRSLCGSDDLHTCFKKVFMCSYTERTNIT